MLSRKTEYGLETLEWLWSVIVKSFKGTKRGKRVTPFSIFIMDDISIKCMQNIHRAKE